MRFFANAGVLASERAIQTVAQLMALPVLARHLSMEDFALAALGMTAPVFAGALSDAGLGRSLVRTPRYDRGEWSGVFWLLVGVGLLLSAGVLALSPVFARLYGEPQLVGVMAALSVLPLLQAVNAVPAAELERSDRFPLIASVTSAAGLLSVATAVTLAVAGAGVWALVAQQLVMAAAQLTGFAVFSRFRPALVMRRERMGGHLRFGRDTILASLIATAQSQAPVMLLGRFAGVEAVSLWSMLARLMRLPRSGLAGPVGRIAFVRMAWSGNESRSVSEIYLASLRLLSIALFPGLMLLAACGHAAFPLLLSEKWAALAPIFALAAPGVALECALRSGDYVFMSTGRTALRLRMAAERFALYLAALAAALPFGLEAVVLAYSLCQFAYAPRYWSYLGRCAPLPLRACLQAVAPALLSGAAFWTLHAAAVAPLGLPAVVEIAAAGLEALAAAGLAATASAAALRRDMKALHRPPPATAA